jgi:hypothetical protein
MTPEQKLQILEDFLMSLAHVDDGNVQVLLRSNQEAAAALQRITEKKWRAVIEFTCTGPVYVADVIRNMQTNTNTICSIESID